MTYPVNVIFFWGFLSIPPFVIFLQVSLMFQWLQFCSYIIPVPVIKHFIAGVEESGKYVGFCSLGLSCQPTENVQLREHFKMRPGLSGVLVSKINPLSDAHRVLKKDDIVLAFDGVPIANDGTGKIFFYKELFTLSVSGYLPSIVYRCWWRF